VNCYVTDLLLSCDFLERKDFKNKAVWTWCLLFYKLCLDAHYYEDTIYQSSSTFTTSCIHSITVYEGVYFAFEIIWWTLWGIFLQVIINRCKKLVLCTRVLFGTALPVWQNNSGYKHISGRFMFAFSNLSVNHFLLLVCADCSATKAAKCNPMKLNQIVSRWLLATNRTKCRQIKLNIYQLMASAVGLMTRCMHWCHYNINQFNYLLMQVFFKENVRYLVWTCRDPISLILGTRFSLILGTQFSILGTRIESLKHL